MKPKTIEVKATEGKKKQSETIKNKQNKTREIKPHG